MAIPCMFQKRLSKKKVKMKDNKYLQFNVPGGLITSRKAKK